MVRDKRKALLSRNTGYPVSAQDGNLYADDDKPKYIEEVYNMKMNKYYPIFKARADYWFSDVFNRQQCDMAVIFTTAEERCGWIDDCSANDKAFTTLAKKVGMDVGYF